MKRGQAVITGICLLLAGCGGAGSDLDPVLGAAPTPWLTTAEVQEPDTVKALPSDESLRLGVEHFNRGAYGSAQRYFQSAVEASPALAAAWIGLAASYDRIGRFDLADRAYVEAKRHGGETIQLLNNQGYSYLLRGDRRSARAKFLLALDRDPDNPTLRNNLQLIEQPVHEP